MLLLQITQYYRRRKLSSAGHENGGGKVMPPASGGKRLAILAAVFLFAFIFVAILSVAVFAAFNAQKTRKASSGPVKSTQAMQ